MITHEEAKSLLNKGWIDGLTNEEYEILMKYVYHQEKNNELLGLYQDLFKKLELTVEHDTTDTWAGCVEYNYVEINGGITDEVETVEKIIKLQKELGEMK